MSSQNAKRLLVWVLILFAVQVFTATIHAGELGLTWDASTGGPIAEGYRVYWGTVTPPATMDDVGNVLLWTSPTLQNCVPHYFAVTAYAGTEESQRGTEVSVYPRPDIVDVQSSETGTHPILGNNFDTNLKVWIDAGQGFVQIPSEDVNRVSCTEVKIPDVPMFKVQVQNVALPLNSGHPQDQFSQPWPGPDATVN